ncbi:hypothetical protein WT60_15230 [Burkholderia sp. MSMB617WGS]|nr:hypothetical protein WT60_15230 [Burkholderia sp. MSMB617WGS]
MRQAPHRFDSALPRPPLLSPPSSRAARPMHAPTRPPTPARGAAHRPNRAAARGSARKRERERAAELRSPSKTGS